MQGKRQEFAHELAQLRGGATCQAVAEPLVPPVGLGHPARHHRQNGKVTRAVDELQELVLRRLGELGTPGKPLGYKPAALKSGGKISHEAIRQIALGNRPERMTDAKIEGLAEALSVHPSAVYEAAQTPAPGARWRWPEKFDRLPVDDRRDVEGYASKLLMLRDMIHRLGG